MSALNVFVNPEIPTPVLCEGIPDEGHNRRGAFAVMRDLSEQFATAGIHTEQVWAYLKAEARVETRSQFTRIQWASIACRLQAMRRNPLLFEVFVDGIPDKHFRFYVLATDPTVAVGRPRVSLSELHKPEAWGDFQQLADEIGAELKVTQGQKTTFYAPKPIQVETNASHHNHRFLNGIEATLKIIDEWATASQVFSNYYNKYGLVNQLDVQIGLDILVDAGRAEVKTANGTQEYIVPVSEFTRFLNTHQMSKYHLAEITGIPEDVMIRYADGAKISKSHTALIADALGVQLADLVKFADDTEGEVLLPSANEEGVPNARGEILNVFGDVIGDVVEVAR